MASSTPIPPTNNNVISPIERANTFPHKTSAAVASQTPLIDTTTPAINATPVELDGVSVGVERRGTGGADGGIMIGGSTRTQGEDAERAAILASRSKDPSVIVDVPREPTAEEVLAAKSAEGIVTPG